MKNDWSPQQEDAIRRVRAWLRDESRDQQVFRLAGYAGTGKTTLARHLADDVRGGRVEYCAFTGKASLRMRQCGCVGARTIHSLIYCTSDERSSAVATLTVELSKAQAAYDHAMEAWYVGTDGGKTPAPQALVRQRDELEQLKLRLAAAQKQPARMRFTLNPISDAASAGLLVVDEGSMVDERLGQDLESFGKKILVLYDPAQLAPVYGSGYFVKERPDVVLTEIHRQARDSAILRLATAVRAGEWPEVGSWGDDCEILSARKVSREELALRAVQADQILVGKNATKRASNRRYRELNNLGEGLHPVAGDKLVCLRNDHEAGLLNGSLWRVHEARVLGEDVPMVTMRVSSEDENGPRGLEVLSWTHWFLGREEELKSDFGRRDAQEFDYGYALTVHKAQGSQWDDVLLFDESSVFSEWRRWLYTGITRAAKRLTVVR